jgi:hypothetical protein
VFDVGGNVVDGPDAVIPSQEAVDASVDFSDGVFPPQGWTILRQPADVTSVTIDSASPSQGPNVMRCTADPPAGGADAVACIARDLPAGRFEWLAEGRFNVSALQVPPGMSLRLIQFRTIHDELSVAARVRRTAHGWEMGLVVRNPDGSLTSEDGGSMALDAWRSWMVHVRRVGTRESTAILSVDGSERVRLNWDTATADPRAVRAGITRIPDGGSAIVLADFFRVTEATALP